LLLTVRVGGEAIDGILLEFAVLLTHLRSLEPCDLTRFTPISSRRVENAASTLDFFWLRILTVRLASRDFAKLRSTEVRVPTDAPGTTGDTTLPRWFHERTGRIRWSMKFLDVEYRPPRNPVSRRVP